MAVEKPDSGFFLLNQIVDNEYAKNLDAGFETVLCYGIAFFQKEALVRKG